MGPAQKLGYVDSWAIFFGTGPMLWSQQWCWPHAEVLQIQDRALSFLQCGGSSQFAIAKVIFKQSYLFQDEQLGEFNIYTHL